MNDPRYLALKALLESANHAANMETNSARYSDQKVQQELWRSRKEQLMVEIGKLTESLASYSYCDCAESITCDDV